MIIDLILLVAQVILETLLLPLSVINIGIDFVASLPVIAEFLQIIAYILPWSNLLPLFAIIFASFIFRISIALLNLFWHMIPIIGN